MQYHWISRRRTMKKLMMAGLVASAVFAVGGMQAQVKQDMKDAGHDTADAGRTVGHDTAHGTSVAAHKTAHVTKKGYHKTVHGTKTGYHKTVNGTKTAGRDVHNTFDPDHPKG
jgi:hypothetical protein